MARQELPVSFDLGQAQAPVTLAGFIKRDEPILADPTSSALESSADDKLLALVERSEQFEEALLMCFPPVGPLLSIDSEQCRLAASACHLCMEHASVARAAFTMDAPNSASAVLRLQYEALLRAAWLVYVANPAQISKLGQDLTQKAELAVKNLPGASEMLAKVLEAAPQGLTAHLAEFNQYSRHALNSYVHSGIHPLRRVREGFPEEMALQLLRISNGLMHMAYRMLATLTGSQRRMNKVTRLYEQFTDCCPMKPAALRRQESSRILV